MGSNKSNRRAYVAKDYRVILIVGDNLGDFVAAKDATVADRAALLTTYKDFWSTKWITVANPMYGSWEAATFGYNFKLPSEEKRQMKLDAMQYWQPKE